MRSKPMLLLGAVLFAIASQAPRAAAGDVFVPDNMFNNRCNVIPLSAAWPSTSNPTGEWRYQTLLLPGWIGQPGLITDIAFRGCRSSVTLSAQNFQMSMSHTTLTTMSATFAQNLPNPTVVIPMGNFSFTSTMGQWTNIKLATPFRYNGRDSLTIEIIYSGGTVTGSSTSISCDTDSSHANAPHRAYQYGANAATSTTARGRDRAGLKVRLTLAEASLIQVTPPKIGTLFSMQLNSVLDPGKQYQVGTSLGQGPIPLGNNQSIGLSVDNLLVASTGNTIPGVFQNYAGFLNATGRGSARIALPAIPTLVGITVYNAFVVFDNSQPNGIGTVSTTLPAMITQ